MATDEIEVAQAVTISYADLTDPAKLDSLFPKLERAFGSGPECLGIVVVSGLPDTFPAMRRRALSYSSRLAHLSSSELAKLENERSSYLVGWSRGREMFMGRPDTNKGSFYLNPTYDYDAASASTTDFPEYESPNLWPTDQLPGFQPALEQLGRFIVDVGGHVARACDSYVRTRVPTYSANHLERMVKESRTCKARLLHYFPLPADAAGAGAQDAWCGEHLDHGCLTGLTSAMFTDEADLRRGQEDGEGDLEELDGSPDPRAGLYIRSRAGRTVKVQIPRASLAFQTGEALALTTDGALAAVPHFVRGSAAAGVARNTLAVFMQPNLDDRLGERALTFAQFARGVVAENYGTAKAEKAN